jgi:hypothetical protein
VTDETKTSPPEEDAAFIDRLEAFNNSFLEKYGKIIDDLVKSRPNYYSRVLVDILKGGLNTLRHCIETPGDPEVSWSSPWVEAHYPAEWDWENGYLKFPLKEWPEPIMDSIRKGEDPFKLKEAEVINTTAEIIAKTSPSLFLQVLTHNVALHIKDGKEAGVFFLDHEDGEKWESLPTDEEKDAMIDELREAVSFGGIQVEDEEGGPMILTPLESFKESEGPPLPPGIKEKLRETPRLTFDGEVNGVAFKGSVVIIIQHLVVNEDKKEAYFPVVVGLVFAPKESSLVAFATEKETLGLENLEEPLDSFKDTMEIMNPATWPEKDREELWKMLLVDLPAGMLEGLENGDKTEPALLVPVGALSLEKRHLLNLPTRIPRNAAMVRANVGKLRLPRKWGDIKKWDDLVEDKIKRISEDIGEEAFQDLRRETGDPNAHGKLLERRFKNNAETIELTRESKESLLAEVGPKGYRDIIKDKDGLSREYLIKRFPVRGGSGYMETRLSWYGQAWPLVDEGRKKMKETLEAARKSLPSLPFDDLENKEKERVNSLLRAWESIRDARHIMDVILHDFGAIGENPLKIPAWKFRTLLECEKDPDGFRRVQGCLRALQEIRFHLKVAGVQGLSQDTSGPFLADVRFIPRGAGDHTDGDFFLTISEAFVGCLKVFQTVDHRIRDPYKALVFDWGKKLSKEERTELKTDGFLKRASSLAPFLDRAKGFTENQSNLFLWIDDNMTRRKDPVKKGSPIIKSRASASDADEYRLYGRETCPLLPEGLRFNGALGHYKRSPEQGRKLFGTSTMGTIKSGGHVSGILSEMGYQLPPGAATAKRKEITRKALRDLRVVVEEAFGGIVAGKRGGNWVTLQDAERLPPDIVLKSISWFIFFPPDWKKKIPQDVEAYHAERLARGETSYQVKVTEDRGLAEKAESSRGLPGEAIGLGSEPLWIRLYATRQERKLSQATVGELFGVSQPIVAGWEKGLDPGEDGKVRGKTIPADVVPLLLRWIENGPPPTKEELDALEVRRSVRPGVEKE